MGDLFSESTALWTLAVVQGGFTVLSSSTRVFGQNIYVEFSYGTPLARAIEYAVGSVDRILSDLAHDIDLMKLSDDGITFKVTIYTRTREDGEAAMTEFCGGFATNAGAKICNSRARPTANTATLAPQGYTQRKSSKS